MKAGSLVVLKERLLNNPAGAAGFCFSEYDKGGLFVIFENGGWDGFSSKDADRFLVESGVVSKDKAIVFDSAIKVRHRLDHGFFAEVMKEAKASAPNAFGRIRLIMRDDEEVAGHTVFDARVSERVVRESKRFGECYKTARMFATEFMGIVPPETKERLGYITEPLYSGNTDDDGDYFEFTNATLDEVMYRDEPFGKVSRAWESLSDALQDEILNKTGEGMVHLEDFPDWRGPSVHFSQT